MAAVSNNLPVVTKTLPLVEELIKDGLYDEQFRVIDDEGIPIVNTPYFIRNKSGEKFKGFTDSQGYVNECSLKNRQN
ncbi:hypothetical protein ACP4QI_012180 [Leclercia sp. TB492]|uniref:hypothetical protein n=1 Tax=Leclercia sp. TB492 TaxID=3412682 RepID=UPI003CED4731